MIRFILLSLLLSCYSLAMEQVAKQERPCSEQKFSKEDEQELYLIIGSTRETSSSFGPLIDKIYGVEDVDLTHLTTFHGKATTLDLAPSEIPKVKHIVADARTYDFSKDVIAKVFLERPSTLTDCSSPDFKTVATVESHLKQNYVGAIIENILKSMKPSGTIEVEWSPYTTLLGASPKNLEEYIKANPFNCFLNIDVMLQAVFILGGDIQNIKSLPADIKRPTLVMVQIINRYLRFYHSQGAGKSLDELKSLIYLEAKILLEMIKNESEVVLNYDVHLHNLDTLKSAYQNALFASFAPEYIGKKITMGEHRGMVYDQPGFNSQTFLNFLIDDIAAEQNKAHVEEYLQSLGLQNISIEKGVNPYNGRKNVWMIKAIKPKAS